MEYAEGGDLFTCICNGTAVLRLCMVVTDGPDSNCLGSQRGVSVCRVRRYFRQILEALVSVFHVRGHITLSLVAIHAEPECVSSGYQTRERAA